MSALAQICKPVPENFVSKLQHAARLLFSVSVVEIPE